MFSIGGVTALKQHAFFEFIDWNELGRLEVQPPFNFSPNNPQGMMLSPTSTSDQSSSGTSITNNNNNIHHGDYNSSDLQFFDEGFTQQSLSPSIIEDTLGNSGTISRNDPSSSMDPIDDEYEGFEYMTASVEYTEDQLIEFQQLLQSRIVKGINDHDHDVHEYHRIYMMTIYKYICIS